MQSGRPHFGVHTKLVELFILVFDAILRQSLAHVQQLSVVFPCVAGRVRVVLEVALQYFVHVFLFTNLCAVERKFGFYEGTRVGSEFAVVDPPFTVNESTAPP